MIDIINAANSNPPEPNRNSKKVWIDKISPEHRDALIKLREGYHAGQLARTWTMRKIYTVLLPQVGITLPIAYQTFANWMSTND